MSGLDLADYFNGGREKDLSPPMLPSPPRHVASTATAGSGLRRSISGGMDVTLGDEGILAGDRGGLDGTGGEGLRHRHVTGGDESDGEVMPTAVASAEANGFGGAADGSVAGAKGRASFNVAPGAVYGAERELTAAIHTINSVQEGPRGRMEKAGSMSTGALVDVFKGMMKERLVLVTFVLQVVRPAQDLAPLVALKFEGGASVLAGITSSRSLCRVLVPMTPLIPWLVRIAGGSSSAGATARMGGDRAVAAFMCVLMAGLAACIPAVGTLRELHHLMMFKGLCYIVRESTAGAVMARAAGTASVGAFFGWQHCIKGVQGTFSHFLTGWLSGYSISLPYYVVAFCDLVYAFAYLYI